MNNQSTLDALRRSSPQLSVGILTANMMELGSELRLLEDAGVRLVHIDVMDGKVWPRITVGAAVVGGLETTLLKDVHLLIDKPEKQIENFAKAGADIIVFNVEHCGDPAQALAAIGRMENVNSPERGIVRGVSLYPGTPVDTLRPVIGDLDIVVLLAVGPDTGKENFLSGLPAKMEELKALREDVAIGIDGAIKKDNVAEVAAMGPDVIVAGSAVFDGKDPERNLKFMMRAIGQ